MRYIADLEQQSEEWHKFRQGKIGSSDAPIIMGESEYCTPFQLWEEKVGISERKKNDFLEKFVRAEEPIRQKLSAALDKNFKPCVGQSLENERLIASFDGVDAAASVAIEIKHTDKQDHETFMDGNIPEKYYAQIQHQYYISNFATIIYVNVHKEQINFTTVPRDDEYIKKLVEKEILFLQNIDDFVAPELGPRDYNTIDTDEWRAAAQEWKNLTQEIKLLTSRQEMAKKSLISISQGKNTIGCGLKLQRIIRKGAVEYSQVPELKGVNLETYRKPPVETWRII